MGGGVPFASLGALCDVGRCFVRYESIRPNCFLFSGYCLATVKNSSPRDAYHVRILYSFFLVSYRDRANYSANLKIVRFNKDAYEFQFKKVGDGTNGN